jgi:hypothetical protein
MPRKKQRRSKAPQLVFYIVQITGWDWSYSFGVSGAAYRDEKYSDFRHLEIRGTLLLPSKIKVETVELALLCDISRAELERKDQPPPPAIGSLNIERSKSEGTRLRGYLSMPIDALGPVMQMLLADRFKYVELDGESMRYRKALIRHYELMTELNVEDYPDGV